MSIQEVDNVSSDPRRQSPHCKVMYSIVAVVAADGKYEGDRHSYRGSSVAVAIRNSCPHVWQTEPRTIDSTARAKFRQLAAGFASSLLVSRVVAFSIGRAGEQARQPAAWFAVSFVVWIDGGVHGRQRFCSLQVWLGDAREAWWLD